MSMFCEKTFDQFLDIWWGSHSKGDFHSILKFRDWHFYQKVYLENVKIYFSPNWELRVAFIHVQKFSITTEVFKFHEKFWEISENVVFF